MLPPVQLEHAWAILPTGFQDLREALNRLPWYTHVDSLPALGDAQRHLFVDGSCLLPRNQHLRLASWSVVLGSISLQEVPATLAAGTLPTIAQTSFRAEIFAFLIALRIAEASTVTSVFGLTVKGSCLGLLSFLMLQFIRPLSLPTAIFGSRCGNLFSWCEDGFKYGRCRLMMIAIVPRMWFTSGP